MRLHLTLPRELANLFGRSLELSDKAYSEVTKSGIHASSRLEIEPPWNSASNAVAISNEQLTNEVKTICPWWSTPGYQCREHEKGKCSWAHEETPNGLKDPLICSFWADGSRCAVCINDMSPSRQPCKLIR